MEITVASKRLSSTTLMQRHPNAQIIDVTSRGPQPWVRFSPFYPHGGIPVPFSEHITAASVEGIWQGLKVFANADIDRSYFTNQSMTGLKRTVRRFGAVQGHRAGVHGTYLLSYGDARHQIYLPSYRWVLEHCLQEELMHLQQIAQHRSAVLLDYETNPDIDNLSRPLSHAALIVHYLNGMTE